MRCTALVLCLCAALVGSAVARPGGWWLGGGGWRHGDRHGHPGWGPGHDGPDAINVTIGVDTDAFLTGSLNEDFCGEASTAGKPGGWSKIDTVNDLNDLELSDEELRNVTLAVMTRALPRRSLRCRPENRTESIEGCSRVVEGSEYQLRLTVTCERRNRTDGGTVEVTGVVDALVSIPVNDVPSINITGVELSIGDEWVNGTELWESRWRPGSARPVAGGLPLPGQGPLDPPQDQPQDKPQDQPKDQPGPDDKLPQKPGDGDQPAAPPKPAGDDKPLV